jgi:hypothetical protein
MTRDLLKDGEMLLTPSPTRTPSDPVAHGWRRDGAWFVGLVAWRNGGTLRVIDQGRERA